MRAIQQPRQRSAEKIPWSWPGWRPASPSSETRNIYRATRCFSPMISTSTTWPICRVETTRLPLRPVAHRRGGFRSNEAPWSTQGQLQGTRQLDLPPARPRPRSLRPGASRQDHWSSLALPKDLRNAPEHAYDDTQHGDLRAAITAELTRIMAEAYGTLGTPYFAKPS
jgi:hypothetical protein